MTKTQTDLQQHNAILKSAKFSIITTDTNGLITSFNEEAERILGYKSIEVVGLKTPEIFNLESEVIAENQRIKSYFKESIALGFETFTFIPNKNQPYEKEWTYVHKNGSHIPVSLNITPLTDEQGKLIGYMGIGKDITKEKQTQETLSKQQETINQNNKFLNFLFDSSQLGSWNWNLKDNSVKFDKKWCDMLGLDFSKTKQHLSTWENRVHPDDLAKCFDDVKNYLDKKTDTYRNIHRVKHEDGSWRYILDQGKIFKYDIDGSPLLFIGTHLDITQIKEMELRLLQTEKIAKIGNWSYSLKDQKIVWSDQLFKIFEESKIKGPPSYEEHYRSIHEEDRELWANTVKNCIESHQPYVMKFRTVTPSGNIVWIEAHGSVQKNNENEVVGLFGTCQDITEKVIQEQKLEKEQQLNIKNSKLSSLGELSAGIAHEINNPLCIIAGNIDLLKTQCEKEPKLLKRIDAIEKATFRIAKIVSGLKKFSNFSKSSVKEILSVSKIINESLSLAEIKTKRLDIPVYTEIDEDCWVKGNEAELGQVLISLVSNSVDAIQDNEEKWIKVKSFKENNQVIVQVIDSGKGLSQNVKNKIFEPFFTTKDVGMGTGLGLSVSKGILDEHEGSISLNSNMCNTCFEIKLPLQEKGELNEKAS